MSSPARRSKAAAAAGAHAAIEARIGYRFKDPGLLAQALTHRSFGASHNERLEFLGDSVLGCVVSESLYRLAPELAEGKLSRLRAELIRQESLAAIARGMGLSAHLRLDRSTASNGGAARPSILANALEAVYGAVLLDGGYAAARRAIECSFGPALAQADDAALRKDAKSRLQEYLHAKRLRLPQYRIVSTNGPKQSQVFEVECLVEDLQVKGSGSGGTRRRAEQEAASRVLEQLGA